MVGETVGRGRCPFIAAVAVGDERAMRRLSAPEPPAVVRTLAYWARAHLAIEAVRLSIGRTEL